MFKNATRFTLAAFFAVSLAITAGCGGGGSSDNVTSDSQVLPIGTNSVTGPTDPIQDILEQLTGVLGGVPLLGDTSSALVGSLISLLDAPDGLASGFQDFLTSQDPQALISGGQLSGDAILSFAAGLSETLIQLSEEGTAIPGSELLVDQLLSLQQMVQNGFTGASAGGDLTLLTDTLVDIADSLGTLSDQVPAEVQDAPVVSGLFAALSQGTRDLSGILTATGQLDGEATSNALVGSFENLLTNLTAALPGDAAAPLNDAVASATGTFSGGLALLLDPLFQSLSAVLGPVTGNDAPLNDLLSSLLSSDLAGLGGPTALGDLLEGGGMGGDGLPIPVLGDLLAGLPLLGDLLAGLTGGTSPGGLPLLDDVLSGNGDLPLLGDLLAGAPGLSGPGGGAASLPLVGDLLTSLLSLDGDGVPIISDILAAGGDGAGGLDIPVIGDVLDGLLDQLIGLAGGLDASGGFLDGLDGIPVLGPLVSGLLGGLLGGLTGG